MAILEKIPLLPALNPNLKTRFSSLSEALTSRANLADAVVTMCNGPISLKATRSIASGHVLPRSSEHNSRLKLTRSVSENTPSPPFSNFSPNESGGVSLWPFSPGRRVTVQPRVISLQNLSQNEKAVHLQRPTGGAGCSRVCTTWRIAQKNHAKPVGGRGISAFSKVFFFPSRFSMECISSGGLASQQQNEVLFIHTVIESEWWRICT